MDPTTSEGKIFKMKDKAVEKMKVLMDKKECEEVCVTQNKGYELTRAIGGLEANKRHLNAAEDELARCIDEEGDIDSLENAKQLEIAAADNALKAAEIKHTNLLASIESKYQLKAKNFVSKFDKKRSARRLLLEARVKRFEEAVKGSENHIHLLETNVPKSLIRATYAAKPVERQLEFVKEVEEMSAIQQLDRDAYFNKFKKKAKVIATEWKEKPDSEYPESFLRLGEDPNREEMRRQDELERKRIEREQAEKKARDLEIYMQQREAELEADRRRQDARRAKELADRREGGEEDLSELRAQALLDDAKGLEEAADADRDREKEDYNRRLRHEQEAREMKQKNEDRSTTLTQDSDDEVYTPEELEEAKARLRNIYKAPKPEPQDAPNIIMNTKLKKPVKRAGIVNSFNN